MQGNNLEPLRVLGKRQKHTRKTFERIAYLRLLVTYMSCALFVIPNICILFLFLATPERNICTDHAKSAHGGKVISYKHQIYPTPLFSFPKVFIPVLTYADVPVVLKMVWEYYSALYFSVHILIVLYC